MNIYLLFLCPARPKPLLALWELESPGQMQTLAEELEEDNLEASHFPTICVLIFWNSSCFLL